MKFLFWTTMLVGNIFAADWPAIHGNADHTAEQLTLPLSLAWVTQADQAPSMADTDAKQSPPPGN